MLFSLGLPVELFLGERAVAKDTDASTLGLSFSSTLNTLLILVIVVAILFFAREVLLPVALAGILSFMLAPLVRRLQNLWVPRRVQGALMFASLFGAARADFDRQIQCAKVEVSRQARHTARIVLRW